MKLWNQKWVNSQEDSISPEWAVYSDMQYNAVPLQKLIEQFERMPGIGRKTANLICGDIYKKPAIIADTHCIRLSNRLGLVKDTEDPHKVENQLVKIIPAEHRTKLCHNLVHHGRAICSSRSPKCNECKLSEVCSFFKKTYKQGNRKADK